MRDGSEAGVNGLTGRVGRVLVLQIAGVLVLVGADGGVQHLRGRVQDLRVSVVAPARRMSHATTGRASSQMIQSRILGCVRIRPGCIQVSHVKTVTKTGLEHQVNQSKKTTMDTWER